MAEPALKHWDRRLPDTLRTKRGRTAGTLREAAQLLADSFDRSYRSAGLDAAAEALIRAAQTGKRDDVLTAVDMVRRTLESRHLI